MAMTLAGCKTSGRTPLLPPLPADLATVATTGAYSDLTGKPYTVPAGGVTGQVLAKKTSTDGDTEWITSGGGGGGGGDMLAAMYDPNNVEADAFDAANFKVAGGDFLAALPWYARGIGEIVYIDTSIAGVSVPPSSHSSLVYILLTAGKTGSGQFNEGKLTSESVTGSAPLVLATATISVTGSPIDGETIHLLNTEGRILRPSETAGALQNDQVQQITGGLGAAGNGFYGSVTVTGAGAITVTKRGDMAFTSGSTGAWSSFNFDSANSPGARAGTETRMKNLGVTAYMRVK